MIRVFENLQEYNTFTNNGQNLVSGDLYWVKGEKSAFFLTNNIDGEVKKYDMMDEIPEGYIIPTGNIAINANGEEIDISQYATASVNVPIPEGYIVPNGNKEITQNGTNIDIAQYATASVNVPIPEGYIVPSGNKEITANGTNIDVAQYATATVAVPQPTGNISITENGENIDVAQYATATVNVDAPEKDYIVKSEEYDPTATYSGEFKSTNHITSVTIPSGFTSIGDSAFSGFTKLTSMTIPDSVTSIGNSAFRYCSGLTNIVIPDSVTSIGNSAFYNCRSITSMTIPEGVTSIGDSAFSYCSGLTNIVIPDSVTSIGYDAFSYCSKLTSMTIPEGVTSIGNSTFYNCSGLKTLDLPSTITSLNNISGNTNYLNLIIRTLTPPQLNNNDRFYFVFVDESVIDTYKSDSQWGKFQILSLPIVNDGSELILQVSVSSGTPYNELEHIIQTQAYKNINKLTIDGIEQETIDKDKVMTGEHTLKICFTDSRCLYEFTNTTGNPDSIKSITIPDSVTSIGDSAFSYCSGLTNIVIPDSVTSIGNSVFYNCRSITSMTIPEGVTSIGYDAFSYCSKLTSMTINATTPPTLGSSAFTNTNNCPIYVPAESVDAYKAATNWSSLADRIQAIPAE